MWSRSALVIWRRMSRRVVNTLRGSSPAWCGAVLIQAIIDSRLPRVELTRQVSRDHVLMTSQATN
jgi:hypothetical protein